MIHRPLAILTALFYAYGAAVHVMNMASLTGFAWFDAPLRAYLDALVVCHVVTILAVTISLRVPSLNRTT